MEHRPHVTLAGICCSRLDGGKQAFQARTTGSKNQPSLNAL